VTGPADVRHGIPSVLARRILLAATVAVLLLLAWGALSGGIRQISRAGTVGQQVQTAVQLAVGVMSLLVIIAATGRYRWRFRVDVAWAGSLILAAGLSSLVWGPPMPLIALLFSAAALIIALAVLRVLRATLGD
jgi:hypothetical protein